MNLIGKRVKHNKFGEGTIVEQSSSIVSVKFATRTEVKKFQYPSCFKTFLKLLDSEAAEQADETVKQFEENERIKKEQARKEADAHSFAKKMQEKALILAKQLNSMLLVQLRISVRIISVP